MKFIDKLFNLISPGSASPPPPIKTLQDLEIFDTVWVKDLDGNIQKGWVFDLTKKHIIVTIPMDGQFQDYRFRTIRPLTNTEIKQNDIVLYLNDPM